MTQAAENQSALAMMKLFESVIDHGTAAHADKLFLDLKQSSQQTRADVYSLLTARAVDQATKDIAAWNDFQWQQGPRLDEPEYGEKKRALVSELAHLKPLAQIFYRLSQHDTKEANSWISHFGEEFSMMTPENKNSVEALADSFAATLRQSAPAAAEPAKADPVKKSHEQAEQNHQELRDIYKKRHLNTGLRP